MKLNPSPRAALRDPDMQRELREHATLVNMITEGQGMGQLGNYANDAAAAAGGVPLYGLYRNGNAVQQRIA